MHRSKSHFAARVNRAATALERRGIIATYKLHDRFLSNQGARRKFQREMPTLDEAQQRLVDSLRSQGYALLPFTELFSDGARWEQLDAEGARFIQATEEGLAREAAGETDSGLRRTGKEFVVRRDAYGSTIRSDDSWLQVVTDPRLLDVANAYLGLWSKLEYVDLWYTAPQGEDSERRGSQRWHRDYDDRYLLKVFVYLTDVDDEAGPFEFVPRSQPGGSYDQAWPWYPMSPSYPPQEKMAADLQAAAETFKGSKGTMILCNTSGFHRGGYVTGKPRVLATATYCSPASLAALTERNYTIAPDGASRLAPPARYAVS